MPTIDAIMEGLFSLQHAITLLPIEDYCLISKVWSKDQELTV